MKKKTKTKLLIGIRSIAQLKEEMLSALKRADAGLPGKAPVERLYFTDQKSLFSTLSPKRWELMGFLRKHGPMSIKKLAFALKRDYKNVYDDVQHLLRLELIQREQDGLFTVPWDSITIELALAA